MSSPQSFQHLLAPGCIGTLQLRNRICMAPMGVNLAEADGQVGQRMIRYFEERARGGAGLLITGVTAVGHPVGVCNPNQIGISDDAFLPGLSSLTERVHRYGAKIAAQLQHGGKVATQDMGAGRPLWVPSVPKLKRPDLFNDLTADELAAATSYMARPGAGVSFHEMTLEDIAAVIEMFADAAGRAQRAGFDGVEIHAAHGYLLSSFLSPASNKRTDAYGGPLSSRAKLLSEVLTAVRGRVGSEFPVWCRLDAKEFGVEGGISEEDARSTAEIAEAAGADAIHVSAYADPSRGAAFTVAPLVHEPGAYVELAAAIKQRVGVPVIAVGRIEPDRAEAAIAHGQVDFVAMARKLLADPELPNKLMQERIEDVRPCVYSYTCVGNVFQGRGVGCAVNPAVGREESFQFHPADNSRHVVVVGGGPAGMEAARVCALRGHRVTLLERSGQLGGLLCLSALVNQPNARFIDYLRTQIGKLSISVRLGTQATASLIAELGADVVVVAVGAQRPAVVVPGLDQPHVLSGQALYAWLEAGGESEGLNYESGTHGTATTGDRDSATRKVGTENSAGSQGHAAVGARVVVVGGDIVGVELAQYLSRLGRSVTVLETGEHIAPALAVPRRWRLLDELRQAGVPLLCGVTLEAIGENEIRYSDAAGNPVTISADTVVVADRIGAALSWDEDLSAIGADVHRIGDGSGYLESVLADATRLALRL